MKIAVVGAGPAGLMAAEAASAGGAAVTIYDHMPSPARKFLMAGKSGLNITHTEEEARFLARYRDERVRAVVKRFGGGDAVRAWMKGLGIDEHIGSSGRVFPRAMKASPLLRAWLRRLEAQGVKIVTRHRLTGWDGGLHLRFSVGGEERAIAPDRVIFAMGGGSWARLGSDGAWTEVFAAAGHRSVPFEPSNVGLVRPWSEKMAGFEGRPVKNVRLTAPDGASSRGEFVITRRGLESGAVFPLSPALRDGGILTVDLLPDRSQEEVAARLARQAPAQSLSNRLRKAVRIEGVKKALFFECSTPADREAPEAIARRLKALPLTIAGTAPLDEAISTTGGVPWTALSDDLEVTAAPGVFCAGEMIDWDAPTGGYLITACLATGWAAGRASRP